MGAPINGRKINRFHWGEITPIHGAMGPHLVPYVFQILAQKVVWVGFQGVSWKGVWKPRENKPKLFHGRNFQISGDSWMYPYQCTPMRNP